MRGRVDDKKRMKKRKKKADVICGILSGIILAAVIVFAVLMIQKENKVKEYRTVMNEGNRYYEEENYEAAKDNYLKAIQIDERQVAPYLRAADTCQKMGDVQQAQEILAQAEKNFEEERFATAIEQAREKLEEVNEEEPEGDAEEIGKQDNAEKPEEQTAADSEQKEEKPEEELPAEWTAFDFPKDQWIKLSKAAAVLTSFGDKVVTAECSEEQIADFLQWYLYGITDEEIPIELERTYGNDANLPFQFYYAYSQDAVDQILNSVFGKTLVPTEDYAVVEIKDGRYYLPAADGAAIAYFRYNRAEKKEAQVKVLAELQEYGNAGTLTEGMYWIYLEEDPESISGYRFLSVEKQAEAGELFQWAEASSVLESSSAGTYGPENVLDRNPSTAWVEGVDGLGIGESKTLTSDQVQKVHGGKILEEYWKNTDILTKNSYPYKFRLEFSDGTTMDVDTGTNIYSGSDHGWLAWASESVIATGQYKDIPVQENTSLEQLDYATDFISFGKEIETSYIKITILEVHPGTKYEDTCISEIIPY